MIVSAIEWIAAIGAMAAAVLIAGDFGRARTGTGVAILPDRSYGQDLSNEL